MAAITTTTRRKQRRGIVTGFFRSLYPDLSQLLATPNDELIDQYMEKHPNTSRRKLSRVKANLANLKSQLRKQDRELGRKHKPTSYTTTEEPVEATSGNQNLEILEEMIDDCLSLAKNIDREELDSVIKRLRRARNEVVWKIDH